ncbi:S1C family serine protease [Natrinema longum]|uniref:Trypsin-like peptidase domain-containing protein n=1 Tax=Natrinema longum TaxID=370324 RepID=A0A8A2UD28_9EURY|nr:trypsin-like peptidase domain-containing protein [Natrinema longum]MBZ6495398.1 trypsin-like peptidase domain-containing protein [Natrinema longum]QSW86629.1 trypsin-like peptidase domain-containing protein [Natrinema longum]
MHDSRLGRRSFLAAASAGLAGAVAGCAEPRVDSSIEGDSSYTIDRGNLAAGSAFTDLYNAIIEAVTQVRVFGIEDPATGAEGRGQGSGFLYDERHVVTNDHVIADGEVADLQYITGDWTSTTLAGRDYHSDLAVLEVDHVPDGVTPLSLTDRRPVVGQQVAAVGNPYGLEGTMSTGIVSGVDRTLDFPDRQFAYPNVVQTDAAVNPGNSGGPLVDLEGDVVGVINSGGGDNIGFAISAALAERVIPALVETGSYDHSEMGIERRPVDRLVAEANDLEAATGVIVTDVVDGSGADGVLQPSTGTVQRRGESLPVGGDVVLAMDGHPIPDHHALATYLALETSPGDTVTIRLRRDGETITRELTLDSRPTISR